MRELIPKQRSILIVEDNDILRSTLAEFFLSDGWHVVEANGGEQALQLMEEKHQNFKIVLFDRRMVNMSGSEFFRKSHTRHTDIRYVMLSGTNQDSEINELLANGLDAFASKPISRIDLLGLVNGLYEVISPQ